MMQNEKVGSDSDLVNKGKSITDIFTNLNTAISETFIRGENALGPLDKLTEKLTGMENAALGLQRSMGGVFGIIDDAALASTNAQEKAAAQAADKFRTGFQTRLNEALKSAQEFGGSFKDIVNVTEGLADAMGRVVNPSKEVIVNMVALSKTTGLSTKEIGSMVEKLTSFGYSQENATEKIHEMAVAARRVGLDATKFIKTMSDTVDKVGGFGFKDGIKSLTRMNQQAQMLKTTFGAMVGNLQDSVLSPEGAMEAAAKFQLLGGAVGKLGDPFQLLYMAQSDLEGLNKELTNSAKSAFKFNTETGEFKASVEDMYRLKEQAAITGTKMEDLVKAGREAAKIDYVKQNFDLDGLSQESKDLLAGLAQVGEGGKVEIDIPGFGKVTEEMVKSGEVNVALEQYQKNAAMDEKQLAIKQLTTTERTAKDVEIIRNSVALGLEGSDREKIMKAIRDSESTYAEGTKEMSQVIGKELGKQTAPAVTTVSDLALEKFGQITGYGPKGDPTGVQQGKVLDAAKQTTTLPDKVFQNFQTVDDLFVPEGGRPLVMAAGKLFQGIKGDEVAMGTKLSQAINSKSQGPLSGAIDVNINLSGSISGDNGQVSKMFNSPEIQKQIMDTVLYKLNDYKRQQGVLS